MRPPGRAALRRWRRRWRRWRARDAARRRLLVRAGVLVLLFRGALRILPFARVRSLADRLAGADGTAVSGAARSDGAPRRGGAAAAGGQLGAGSAVAHEVEAAARTLAPARPCLPQALAGYVLLRRAGRPATLHIGVRRAPGDASSAGGVRRRDPRGAALEAHAWVECAGRVVVGAATEDRGPGYARLLDHGAGARP